MTVLARVHGAFVHPRRTDRLSELVAALVPSGASVLDVGSGDGLLSAKLLERRPDLTIRGVDVLLRPETRIPTTAFDGLTLPFEAASFDVVLLVDVVHHAEAPVELIAEAARVARAEVILKDHLLEGPLAAPTLRFMDRVGNVRHGVAVRYDFWPRARWRAVFDSLSLSLLDWNEHLGIYPWPASLVFDRSLHFVARLRPR